MSNDDYRDVLETKRVEIVRSINCERSLLINYLRSKHVFDKTDAELIRSASTNDARVGKLIDFLLMKGPEAYQHFLHVVQIESPMLYKSMTGNEPTSQSNPLMRQLALPELQPGEFSQLQPLVEYQQRMLQDLTDSAQRYREVLKANEILEKKLEKANKDLEFEKDRSKHYENRLSQEMQIDESLQKNEVMLYYEYDEMEKGIADRDVYIIVLQMKLLAEKEEVEKLKSKVEQLEHKSGDMARELRQVSQSYNQERCQSMKLSECIRIQGDEIQKIDDLRKQVRECKYKTIIVTEERDTKIQELAELKKWTEALKARFDVIEKEKQNSIEKSEVVSNNCVFLSETVRTLTSKLSSSQLELEELRKRNELLTKDCELFKTQRNYALEARKEAVNHRDKLAFEKDTIQAQCNDLIAKHEKMNEERQNILQTCDSLHTRYKSTSEDLTRVKTALNEKELEVEDLIRKLKEANDKNHRNSVLLENLPGLSDCSDEDDNESAGGLAAEQLKEAAEADEETDFRRPWRERRMKSLLNSIKYRIAGDRASEEGTLTREHVGMVAGNVTMDVLKQLLPNLSTRPCSVTTVEPSTSPNMSRTLQRHKCLRQKKMDRSSIETKKHRSKTAPCVMEGKFSDIFAKLDESWNGVRSSSSTPDLMYPEDVNQIPPYFRSRSKNMTKNFQRAKSTD